MRPMTPADCCLSKCQYSLQKTDLRQSELGLLRGEEHRGLHRPGGDGADVCSQVRDWGGPLIHCVATFWLVPAGNADLIWATVCVFTKCMPRLTR